MWCAGKCLELMDPLLENTYISNEVEKFIQIGLLCVQEAATTRPTMSMVMVLLASDVMIIPKPNKPAFSVGRMTSVEMSASESSKNISINDLSISSIVPR